MKLIAKSKYSQIDQTALNALNRIHKTPPIPPGYKKDSYVLKFIFHYKP